MLTAFVHTNSDSQVRVTFDVSRVESEEGAPMSEGPNPIMPEPKELLWGAGSFIVFLICMRLYLVPKVRKGMANRYESIQSDHQNAASIRDLAKEDVAEYDAAIAKIHREASLRLETARQELDQQRQVKVAEVNSRIAAQRKVVESEVAAARLAAQGQIATAVAFVASRATQIASGVAPDTQLVSRLVEDAIGGKRK